MEPKIEEEIEEKIEEGIGKKFARIRHLERYERAVLKSSRRLAASGRGLVDVRRG